MDLSPQFWEQELPLKVSWMQMVNCFLRGGEEENFKLREKITWRLGWAKKKKNGIFFRNSQGMFRGVRRAQKTSFKFIDP